MPRGSCATRREVGVRRDIFGTANLAQFSTEDKISNNVLHAVHPTQHTCERHTATLKLNTHLSTKQRNRQELERETFG